MATDIELALLSSLVNADIKFLTDEEFFIGSPAQPIGAGGQAIENFIASVVAVGKNGIPLYGVNGWKPSTIELSAINTQIRAAGGADLVSYDQMGGMVAATFVKGTEAVISFRGTEQEWRDYATDITLGKLAGFAMPVQVKAAYYYVQAAIATLPPRTKITFTGHSLGGGLASIMAHYFGGNAVVFDAAPNRGTAEDLRNGFTIAGGFGGFMGMDPLVLDLDGDGVELTREDSSKVYFEFDTDGFGERCGWVDAAVNDNLPPQYLTRRRAA